MATASKPRNAFFHSTAGLLGLGFLSLMFLLCLGSLPWTLTSASDSDTAGLPRYNAGNARAARLPPMWWPYSKADMYRSAEAVRAIPQRREQAEAAAADLGVTLDEFLAAREGEAFARARELWPRTLLGTDQLGRSLFVRVLTGGGISLGIGLAAAFISVGIGTLYGAISAYAGGKVDAAMMRIVDVLYGLPYILLVVLIAVAVDGYLEDWVAASGEDIDQGVRTFIDVLTLLLAISAVSWLTMARVIRGQVLSLRGQPFVEAARALGAPRRRIFFRHLLPNLVGPIAVYATLAVPQAILQESFLSFLGIGVKPPLPSWGNLAADGLGELNTHRSNWWLLFFPSLLLGVTLLALNFVGEGLREAFDPRRARR